MTDRWKCPTCTSLFRIGDPLSIRADWTRCHCGQLFWHAESDCRDDNGYGAPPKTIVCGIAAVRE